MTWYIEQFGSLVTVHELEGDYEAAKHRLVSLSDIDENLNKVFGLMNEDGILLLVAMNGDYLLTK